MRFPRSPSAVVATLLVVALAAYFSQAGESGQSGGGAATPSAAEARPASGALEGAQITRVVDGDTIHARLRSGSEEKVRLIGIDTPETSTLRNGHTECGGESAARATQALAARWPTVNLVTDPGQDAYDQYGRLLAYIEPPGSPGTTFQEQLLGQGWARVYVYDQDPFGRVDRFRAAARKAQAARAGVWSLCAGDFRQPLP